MSLFLESFDKKFAVIEKFIYDKFKNISHRELVDIGEDDHHPQKHNINSHDTKATGKDLDILVSGGIADKLHVHNFPQFFGGGGGRFASGVKISAFDISSSYLENKLIAGSGITLTKNNEGSNESISISVTSSPAYFRMSGTTLELVCNGQVVQAWDA
jgi:hypothetical protein